MLVDCFILAWVAMTKCGAPDANIPYTQDSCTHVHPPHLDIAISASCYDDLLGYISEMHPLSLITVAAIGFQFQSQVLDSCK